MKMSVPAAYLGIILIWATTPLAIKWSGEVGFLFGAGSRMALGLVLCLVLICLLRTKWSWKPRAWRAYLSASVGMYGAMSCVYWGAQFIPSGLVSVLFGLTPLATGVMAALWLGERFLSFSRIFGIGLALTGLVVIFDAGAQLEGASWAGIAAVLTAMLLHSASMVGVKRFGSDLHPLETNTGGLLVAVPLYLITWLIDGPELPAIEPRAYGAIIYLGVFGTAFGFVLYYYVLKRLPAGVIALITLITPVLALLIGKMFNDEPVLPLVWLGTAFILTGLLFYQWGGNLAIGLRHALLRKRYGQ